MSWVLQENSFLTLEAPLGEDSLLLVRGEAAESVSKPFTMSLTALSTNTALSPKQLIGRSITVKINPGVTSQPRFFNGIVQSFQAGDVVEGLRTYHIEASSWLSLLKHTADCRIFQHKTVIEIIREIFQEYMLADYDISRLQNKYEPLVYCVQFHETTLHFIQRILAQAGIFYYFKHTEGKHTLMLADRSDIAPYCHPMPVVLDTHGMQRGHYLTAWQRQYRLYGGKSTQTDYNFETPTLGLQGKASKAPKFEMARKYEIYRYPGLHQDNEKGNQLAQQALEAQEMLHDTAHGSSNYIDFAVGESFKFTEPPVADDAGDYFITHVAHSFADASYLNGGGSHSQSYQNYFSCIPSSIPYRPAPFHADYLKPVIYGPQTAVVVGPEGEEIYTDEYGRVKVHFHWVRNGTKDDKSSCWVRVAQHWAGRGFGTVFIPRIGDEVVVQFLDGDPDRPLIVGSVYNAEHMPPYKLPQNQTQSGIKTHSTKGGGSKDANELRFEDKKGKEEVYLHAQKDFNRIVENTEAAVIVQGDHQMTVKAGESILEAAQAITFKVGSSYIKITPDNVTVRGMKVDVNEG